MPYAQFMMAYQLGGAAFAHGIMEGKDFIQGQLPVCAFFASTCAIQILHGNIDSLPVVLGVHGLLLTMGFGTGYAIFALGAGRGTTAPLNPTRWRKQRGSD